MKKNKLYTVTKGNKNLFNIGGSAVTVNTNSGGISGGYTPRVNWGNGVSRAQALGYTSYLTNNVGNNNNDFNWNLNGQQTPLAHGTNGSISGDNMLASNGMSSGEGGGKSAWASIGSMALQAADTPFEVNGRYYRHGIYDALDPGYHAGETTFADGSKGHIESGLGNAFSDIGVQIAKNSGGNGYAMAAAGAMKAIGNIINNGWGMAYNDKKINEVKQNTRDMQDAGNLLASVTTTSDLLDASGRMRGASGYSTDMLVKGGVFKKGKARDEGYNYLNRENSAQAFQNKGLVIGAQNTDRKVDDTAMSNFIYAYGGPIYGFGSGALGIMQNDKYLATIDNRSNAIANRNTNGFGLGAYTGGAKTFDEGGQLKAAFLDEFSTDPIGAAVRYNRGLEQLEAQREAAALERQREVDLLDMQKQAMLNTELQNQGLQATVPTIPTVPMIPETPMDVHEAAVAEAIAPSPTPSKATRTKKSKNSNWDYIEGQLRKSGKFNDVQIQGIKYNLQRESSIDPTAVGDGGAAFGLGQWHGKRQPKDRSLAGQTQHLIDTLSKYDGKEHWIGKGNYEGFMNARTPEEAHYYIARGYERPNASIVAKVKRDSDMSLKRLNAFGGELGTNGTDFTNGLLYINEGGSHEENPLEGVPMGLDPEGIPNLVEEGETVYDGYVFSDRMNVPDFMLKDLGVPKSKKGISFADASKKLAQESEKRPNDPISQDGLKAGLSKLAEIQETERMKHQAEEFEGLAEYACGGKLGNKYGGNNPFGQKIQLGYKLPKLPDYAALAMAGALPVEEINRDSNHVYGKAAEDIEDTRTPLTLQEMTRGLGPITPQYVPEPLDGSKIKIKERDNTSVVNPEAPQLRKTVEGIPVEEEVKTYPTWMRYAPVFGAGLSTLTDTLGLTNSPDYSYVNKLEAMANRAGYAPNIDYKPIGDYLMYRPMDIWAEQNRLDAIARGAERTIMNSSMPIASKYAALLASNYNNQIANGNVHRSALEYNDAKRKDVAEFNRKTNMFNSQMDLEAAMANARYRQMAAQYGLSGLAQAAALRDSIDARIGAARSTNLSNFFTSLGNIGRENFALNQLNTDRSRRYTTTASGKQGYKKNNKSNG